MIQKITENFTNQIDGKKIAPLSLWISLMMAISVVLYLFEPMRSFASVVLDMTLFGWADLLAILLAKRGLNVFVSIALSAICLVIFGVLLYLALSLFIGQ